LKRIRIAVDPGGYNLKTFQHSSFQQRGASSQSAGQNR